MKVFGLFRLFKKITGFEEVPYPGVGIKNRVRMLKEFENKYKI
jgi:hypothetical protein